MPTSKSTQADRLREAATLMRERARMGNKTWYPAPWTSERMDVEQYGIAARVNDAMGDFTEPLDEPLADYIASWHPPMALLVAAWLEDVAYRSETYPKQYRAAKHAAAIADAYLREVAS